MTRSSTVVRSGGGPVVALAVAAALVMPLSAADFAAPGASGGAAGKQPGPLRVGWASADLTPDGPVHIAASSTLRVSEGVADPIMATVLVLESVAESGAREMLVLVGTDLARAETVLCDRVRELVAEWQPEIDPDTIVISATHNHGAPCVRTAPGLAARLAARGLEVPAEWSYYGIDPDAMSPVRYLEFAAPRIARAIVRAWDARAPGGVGFGLGHAVVSHNRLVTSRDGQSRQFGDLSGPEFSHIEGYEDHSVGLLCTFAPDGVLTGVVVNVPAAAWGMGTKLTADYWCETRAELQARLGKSVHVLPQTSASAELWPRVLVERAATDRMLRLTGRTWRQEIAVRLADAVTAVLPAIRTAIEWNPVFAHRLAVFDLPRLRVTEEQAESRRREFERLLADYRAMRREIEADPEIRRRPRWFEEVSGVYWKMARAFRVVEMFELQRTEPTVPVRLHVVRLGDLAIATFPVALYLDFGIQIKARSKAVQTFTVQTADGHERYLPTRRSLAGNAYGAVPESMTFGPEGGQALVAEISRLIASLWEP